jgi:exoribonuclease-2
LQKVLFVLEHFLDEKNLDIIMKSKGWLWMSDSNIWQDSLVIYKKRPGRVARVGEKLVVEMLDGKQIKVRPKDVTLLHPGPVQRLEELVSLTGEVELAWEIMSESAGDLVIHHDLKELAELIYGEYTPATAWAAWIWLDDGLYFEGSVDNLSSRSPADVAHARETREVREMEALAWDEFLERVRKGKIVPEKDDRYLREVQDLALGRTEDSRVLHTLGRAQRPETAHALLLELGYWDHTHDPYPLRLELPITLPETELPALPDEERRDLTHLEAFAIDDRGSQDPDDAVSLESLRLENGQLTGGRIWVHVADVAALAQPDSPVDLDARLRGATLYLPEGVVPMLPAGALHVLGMGLKEVSPALSFGIEINASAEIEDVEIVPSWVRVERMYYEDIEERLEDEPFASIYRLAEAYQERRRVNDALFIDLPEVKMRLDDGQVMIEAISPTRSRDLVREAMLMAGEAAARFSIEQGIPFPFVTQGESEKDSLVDSASQPVSWASGLAEDFTKLRTLKRSHISGQPAPHAGVGLPVYSRVTSPLRRYLDLVAHQQLRAYSQGGKLLGEQEMLERVGASEAVTGSVNYAERLARRHWTLVYFMQHPGWRGEGVLVEKRGLRAKVIVPELAFETQVQLKGDLPLNSVLSLELRGVNLPELEAYFKIN